MDKGFHYFLLLPTGQQGNRQLMFCRISNPDFCFWFNVRIELRTRGVIDYRKVIGFEIQKQPLYLNGELAMSYSDVRVADKDGKVLPEPDQAKIDFAVEGLF